MLWIKDDPTERCPASASEGLLSPTGVHATLPCVRMHMYMQGVCTGFESGKAAPSHCSSNPRPPCLWSGQSPGASLLTLTGRSFKKKLFLAHHLPPVTVFGADSRENTWDILGIRRVICNLFVVFGFFF